MPARSKGKTGRELRWIEWIRKLEGNLPRATFPLGIGDDAAVWNPRRGACVVLTVDAQVEGVHFRRGWLEPREIGERAVSAGVSDLAAMAATPVALLVAIVTSNRTRDEELKQLEHGIHKAARAYGARVLGGNLSSGPLSITVTAIGEGKASRFIPRSGARPGDEVWVTGSPGLARLGLRCLEQGLPLRSRALRSADDRAIRAAIRAFTRPTARTREALELARFWRPSAMIDLSDGLATDLGHILEESSRVLGRSIGAEIDVDALPVDRRFSTVARICREPRVQAALKGGEDYELCFTARPAPGRDQLARRFRERFALKVTRIGRIVRRPGIRAVLAGGSGRDVTCRGWEHF